jgi:formate dehydrogenase accessory protein FdhE
VSWDERIARARSLGASGSPASDILVFYAKLAEYQRSVRVPSASTQPASSTRTFEKAIDFGAASGAVAGFLIWLQRHGPATLARQVGEWRSIEPQRWRDLMIERVVEGEIRPDGDVEATGFVVDTVLQPYAEVAAAALHDDRSASPATAASRRCPACGGAPVVAALREEGHGARRVLICGLCASEWGFPRVQCPVCEEGRFDALPVYTAGGTEHVRVDACDSCRTYIKTVDLTKDGLAVPIVDDLATLPLDLWARDRGYHRLHPNLLRV